MKNSELAKVFEQIADLLELTDGDRFRVNAYRRAARTLGDLNEDVEAIAERGELRKIPGVGKGMAERIQEYLDTGRVGVHQDLLERVPPGLLKMLDIPGLGPKKIQVLHRELDIRDIDGLRAALDEGRVEALGGFGKKSAEKISEGIAFLQRSSTRTPLGIARQIAAELAGVVGAFSGVRRIEAAGSLRRGCETVGDLDLLCEASDGPGVVKAFTGLPQATSVRAAGDTKGSILVGNRRGGQIQIDLRVVPEASFGAAWQYFTGSKEHNVRLRELAVRKGWRLNEYGLFDGEARIAGEDEEGIYRQFGLPWIPPEMREDRGEFDLERLPELITLDDIRGDLHMHTTASDGRCGIDEMAEAAKRRGYRMIAITDHSKSSAVANGLSVDRLEKHVEAVREADERISGITLLAGTECDILPDGSLDYPDDVLRELDWVVASIHAAQGRDRQQQTRRCIAAMENPYVCVLGHPSGRLLGRRDAMDLDWEALVEAAADTGTALEVNASWQRLDLKDTHVRMAMEAGCWISINTDAHDIEQLDQMELGVQTARRGWATKDRVLNAKTPAGLKKWIAARRG